MLPSESNLTSPFLSSQSRRAVSLSVMAGQQWHCKNRPNMTPGRRVWVDGAPERERQPISKPRGSVDELAILGLYVGPRMAPLHPRRYQLPSADILLVKARLPDCGPHCCMAIRLEALGLQLPQLSASSWEWYSRLRSTSNSTEDSPWNHWNSLEAQVHL